MVQCCVVWFFLFSTPLQVDDIDKKFKQLQVLQDNDWVLESIATKKEGVARKRVVVAKKTVVARKVPQ